MQLSEGKIHRRPCSTDEKDGAQIEFSFGVLYETGSAGFPQYDRLALSALPKITALMSPDQLLEGQRLAEKWKGNVRWPPEIVERLGPPN
jgi:hypothetical protein